MNNISLLEIIRNKKENILKDIEDVDARYDEGNGELYSGDYTEMRDVLDNKLEVVNEILNEYEKVKKPELGSVVSFAEQRKMSNERLTTLLYNALTYLTDVNGTELEELEEELGITEDEYKQVVEDYKDTICCTFGKDELREGLFETETKLTQIVDFIVDTACKNTATGEWYIYAEDVYKALKISKDQYLGLLAQVVDELRKRDEIVDVEAPVGGALDLRLDTDYCKKFEGRIYEYSNGELKKKASLSDKIEEAAGQVKSDTRVERVNEINKER